VYCPHLDDQNNIHSTSIYTNKGLHDMKRHHSFELVKSAYLTIHNYVNFKNQYLLNVNSNFNDFRCIKIVFLSTIILTHHMLCLHHGFAPKYDGCQSPSLGFQAHKIPLWCFVLQPLNPWGLEYLPSYKIQHSQL